MTACDENMVRSCTYQIEAASRRQLILSKLSAYEKVRTRTHLLRCTESCISRSSDQNMFL
jgi:hypothetical protein